MRAFVVPGMSPVTFVDGVTQAIAAHELSSYVSVTLEDDQLVARISRLGTTVLRYRVVVHNDGFRAELTGHRVAPFHTPFREGFERVLEQVVEKAGGSLEKHA